MRSVFPKGALVALALVACVVAGTPVASALSEYEASEPVQGRLADVSGAYLLGASPGYLLHQRQQYDEDAEARYSVVRVSDGATVHTFHLPYDASFEEQPTLVGSSYVLMSETSDGAPSHVEVHDDETGVLRTSIDVSSHDHYVHGDPDWALMADDGATADEHSMHFVAANGSAVDVDRSFSDVPGWVGGDGSTAYVDSMDGVFAIDIATGHTTAVDLGSPDGWLFAVTPDRLIGVQVREAGTDLVYRFTFVDRTTLTTTGTTDLADREDLVNVLPFGSGIAALVGAPGRPESLRPVEAATGELLAPVSSDVVDALPSTDGRIALVLGDVPTGRLAVAESAPATLRSVSDLPEVDQAVLGVALSGATVAASYAESAGVWTHDVRAPGGWQQASEAGSVVEDEEFDYSHGTLLVDTGSSGGAHHYRLEWPGGSRVFDASSAVLGHGGANVVRTSRLDAAPATTVEDVRTGAVRATFADRADHVVDGDWVWSLGPDSSLEIRGQNLVTGARSMRSANCPDSRLEDVRGRWAVVQCRTWTQAVDLGGMVDDRIVPDGARLGDGFVVWTSPDGLAVQTLGDTEEAHVYGPVARGTPGPGFAVNDDGSDVVFVDTTYQLRRVDAAWAVPSDLPPPVGADTTPPRLATMPTLERVVAVSGPIRVKLAWPYVDDPVEGERSGDLARVDVRYREQGQAGWVTPTWWQGLTGTAPAMTDILQPDTGRCYSARATDTYGNTSDWSTPVCQFADAASPVLAPEARLPQFVPWTSGRVPYAHSATDAGGVKDYVVGVRVALPGKVMGSWAPSTAYRSERGATSSVALSGAGRQYCLRYQARDEVGHVSGWSTGTCTSLATDDRSFVRQGRTTRGRSSLAISGTYTQLAARNASVTLAGQRGRKVAIWLLRGPGQGTADVYAAGRRIGRVDGADSRTHKTLRSFWVGSFTGTIKVVQTGSRPVKVDGIAVAR